MSDDDRVRTLHLGETGAHDVGKEGMPPWIPVRHRLGVQAFGTNAYRAAKAGDVVVEEHTEWTDDPVHEPAQEEMYVVVLGRAQFTLDGEPLDAPAGTVVFLPDPTVRRQAIAAEDGTVVLAVGGAPGHAFSRSAWEAREVARLGEPDGPTTTY
jgi:mannose-6-phosphate isomerase-like protein (cupin superfamily)